MKAFKQQLVLALIAATATIAATVVPAVIQTENKSQDDVTMCDKILSAKVCVSNLTVQINSDEPQLVKNHQRLALKTGDNLKVLNLSYCIPAKVSLNRIEVKAVLFKNGIENYQNALLTPSTLPINSDVCHNIGNFAKTWKLEPGKHRAIIPIIKYDGSNRVVDKSFDFIVDVG